MRLPLTFLAVPPLLLLYPLSYLLGLFRLFSATHARSPLLLTASGPVNPVTATPSLVRKLPISFAEDVVVLQSENIAVFSTDPSRKIYNPFTNTGDATAAPGGQLVYLDLSGGFSGDAAPLPLKIEGWPEGRDIHPLGLAHGRSPDEHLFALANMASPPGIEILRLEPGDSPRMTWVRTLSHPALSTPNSVVLLSETQVLVTNSFRYSAHQYGTLNKVETLTGLPLGSVLLLTAGADGDTTTAVTVSEGLSLANGLAISDDGKILAASGSTGQEVQIYDISNADTRPLDPKSVAYRETIPVGFVVDNLRFVPESSAGNYTFLAAGHPSAFEYLATAARKGEGKLSGSTVVKITVPAASERDTSMQARNEVNRLFTGRDSRVQLVFEDSGEFLGTSSTAVSLGRGKDGKDDEMLVCGLFDRGVMWAKGVDLSPVKA